MNVVVIDSGNLAGEADFPMLELPKFGWQQYAALSPEEAAERCWRADIVVAAAAPVGRAVIDKAFKLSLIVAAGEGCGHIDLAAARERGIRVCNVPGLSPGDPAATAAICAEVVANIDAFARGEERNPV